MRSMSAKIEEILKKKYGKYDSSELDDAMDILQKAESIKADKKKMKALTPLLERKAKTIKSIADLKERVAEVTTSDDDDVVSVEEITSQIEDA